MVRWRRPRPAGCDPVVPLLASALVSSMGTAHTPRLSSLCCKNGGVSTLMFAGVGGRKEGGLAGCPPCWLGTLGVGRAGVHKGTPED